MQHQYYCEQRVPQHIAPAVWRVDVVKVKGVTRVMHLCEQCYAYVRANMITSNDTRLERPETKLIFPLSTEDWRQIILHRREPPEGLPDLRIIARYEKDGSMLFAGIYVAGKYWMFFLDDGTLRLYDPVHNDGIMRVCCAQQAQLLGAMRVE